MQKQVSLSKVVGVKEMMEETDYTVSTLANIHSFVNKVIYLVIML